MIYLELVFFILFAVCTVTGYRKNNRNLMLIGAFFSLIAFAVLQAIDGYKAGQSEVNASVSDMN